MQPIEIENIGPIEKLTIGVPSDGGVVVMEARNGRGKSHALNAIDAALSGRGKLEVRDGALNGSIQCAGITIKVGRSTRRSGTLEVESLEGKLSVAEFIDPKLKSPDAADGVRIKSLANLLGIQPDPALFYGLLGGKEKFNALLPLDVEAQPDVVTLAAKIKRELDKKGLDAERMAERHAAEAKAALDGTEAGEAPDPATFDAATLRAKHTAAVENLQRLRTLETAAHEATVKLDQAKARLQLLGPGPDVVSLTVAEKTAKFDAEQAESALREAHAAYKKAESRLAEMSNAYSAAIAARHAAERENETRKAAQEAVEIQVPVAPDRTEMEAATAAVETANVAIETGVRIRQAIEKRQKGAALLEESVKARNLAEAYRNAGKGTDEVLTEIVSKAVDVLRVHQGRLILDTPKRGQTYFHDLSEGERCRIGIGLAVKTIGENGLMTFDQGFWEGLDPISRNECNAEAKARNVVILTAVCSADETIKSHIYEPAELPATQAT